MGSALIIGGGLGGLFTGALLSREGVSVTVIEKNATAGGGLQSFNRFGETFDTGMHIAGGLGADGNIRRICRYLGIEGRMDVRPTGDDCNESVFFAEDGVEYAMRRGRDGFVDSLASYFPGERDNIARYADDVFAMADSFDLYNLRPSASPFPQMPPRGLAAASDFIDAYTADPRLRSLLAYTAPRYGGVRGRTPAYVHSLITALFIRGGSRFVGGAQRFADLLRECIETRGGRVLTGKAATRVMASGRHITGVETADGAVFTADHYISAIHPCALLDILDDEALPKAYKSRISEAENTPSAFSLFIKVKERSFKYVDHPEYFMARYADVWRVGSPEADWPQGFMLMTPPEQGQGEWARKILITAPMAFEMASQWAATRTGARGRGYEDWKKRLTDTLIDRAAVMHPGLPEAIERVGSASPLTIRDYYGAKGGAMYGLSKDCSNIAATQMTVATKAENLLLTGQCVNLHGFCGVPLTAISTAEAIVGRNAILGRI